MNTIWLTALKWATKSAQVTWNVVNMVNGATQRGLTVSKTAHPLEFSPPSLGFAEDGPKRETIECAAVVWRKMPS